MSKPANQLAPAKHLSPSVLLLGFLTLIAVGFVLKVAQSVVVPLLIAWLISHLLGGPVNFLVRRLRFPAPLAVASVVLLLLLISWGAGIVIQQRLLAFARSYPEYQVRLSEILDHYGHEFNLPAFAIKEPNWPAQLAPLVVRTSKFFITFITNVILVLIFLVFMLLAKPYSHDKLRAAFPVRADHFIMLTNTISRQIGTYLGSLFVISLATGLLVWGALVLMNVEFAFTWGLLAFVLNFIPSLGSIMATIPPVLMALIDHVPNFWPAIGVALVLTAIQMTLGNFIAPKIYGDRLNLSPVVILLFLLFWGWLWGIIGMILAVPFAAAIQITLAHIPHFAPLAVMMGSGKRYATQSPPASAESDGEPAPEENL